MYSQLFASHAKLLKALSHPKRLEIIHLLRDQELNVTQILDMLDLPQANISQHLMILRGAGVVKTKKAGKQVSYSIAHRNFVKASDLMRAVLATQYANTAVADELVHHMSDLVPLVHDPVCLMRLSPKTAGFHLKHNARTYYFCASGCLEKFKTNPNKYISKAVV